MSSLRGYLLLLMLLAVNAWQDEMLQRPAELPPEILERAKQFAVDSHPAKRQKGPRMKLDSIRPSIPFPLARPTMENILAICRYSNLRPRYTEDMLPRSGFDYLYRQAGAVNLLESLFTACCSNDTPDEELTLCCAQQAWENSLSAFCEVEFSIKTSHYYCCRKYGQERWDCFEDAAPDPLYQPPRDELLTLHPPTVQGFKFSPSNCQKTSSVSEINPGQEMVTEPPTPRWIGQRMVIPQIPVFLGARGLSDHQVSRPLSTGPSITFPLAAPTTINIHAICQYSNQRLRYLTGMLSISGFRYLHRQTRAVNQLESWYTVCCANGSQDEELTLCCAQQAWENSLSAFCEVEFSNKTSHYYCCNKKGQERWDCFEDAAPDPLYQPPRDELLTLHPPTVQGFKFSPSNCQKTSSVSEINPGQEMVTEPPTPRWIGQRMVIPQIPVFLGARGLSDHQVSRPLSTGPSITFPLAAPTTTNIHAICQYSNQRLRYPKEKLPKNGFGYLHRQASAVNQLESWYTVCCANGSKDDELTLCCAQQAWMKSLTAFCDEEFGVKTSHYHCCTENGPAKWECFKNAASDKSYQPAGHEVLTMHPSTVQGFDFDPNNCQNIRILADASRDVTERAKKIKAADFSFPPGRPNSDNIQPICVLHKSRPRHLKHCLLHTGFDQFAHHLKAMDRLEKSFGECCKKNKDVQPCAEGKWKKMVDRFCKDEKKVQVNQFECCKKERGEERYDCFSTAAPNQSYVPMNTPTDVKSPPNLGMFCDAYPALQKMKRLPFTVDEMAEKCCILVGDEKSACLQLQLDNLLDDACKADNPSLAQVKQICCKETTTRSSKCLTKLLLRNIAKAKRFNKKCPIIL